MKLLATLARVFILVLLLSSVTLADLSIIAPDVPHVLHNVIPFGDNHGGGRHQQVFDASIFASPVQITSLAFSPNETAMYSANVTIRLGHTTVPVRGLSTNLDDNVTSPLTTVLADPSFSQAVTGGSETFSLAFDFSAAPFLYDSTSGQNLLMDMLISEQTHSVSLFGVSRAGDTGIASRAYDLELSNDASNTALRTKIGYIPGPTSTTLGLLGLGTLAVIRRKQGQLSSRGRKRGQARKQAGHRPSPTPSPLSPVPRTPSRAGNSSTF